MKLPTLIEAENLIRQAEERNPGPWGEHSWVVAECVRRIAERCEGMDPEAAYILGLLHDIGRHFGINHLKHVWDGYQYMMELGYEDAARICLTHSFQYQHFGAYSGNIDIPEENRAILEALLMSVTYDDYDRLIQICDGLAMASGVILIEKRIVDVTIRYGIAEHTVDKWKAIFELKDYFERKAGANIYEIVTDDKTLWGK